MWDNRESHYGVHTGYGEKPEMKKKSREERRKKIRKEKWAIGFEPVIIIVSSIITSIENQSKQHNVLV